MEPRDFGKAPFPSLTRIFLLLALSLRESVTANESFCPEEAIVHLTDEQRNSSGFFAESGEFFPSDIVRQTNGALLGCMCDVKRCLLLCSPLRKKNAMELVLESDSSGKISEKFPPIHTTDLTIEDDGNSVGSEDRFRVFVGNPCLERPAFNLDPDMYESDEWYLLGNGSLFLPHQNGTNVFLGWREYCFRRRRNRTSHTPRVCFPQPLPDPLKTLTYIAGLLSAPFLIATIFVYSVLPELRNIHGNTLRCYMCCLLVAHIILAADRIPPPDFDAGALCLTFGFVIYFSFLTSFLWLNVMCFDMWRRFGGCGTIRSGGKLHDRKKFIGYSIYAWGIGIALTAICIGLEFLSDSFPESVFAPGFRRRACWFSTKAAEALYFLGPVGVTLICNVCLFVSTSIRLVQDSKATQLQLSSSDSQRHDENKILFSLYFKLFVVMGINWSTEVISGFWETLRQVWYITDVLNALHGIVIFVIFICKKKIWQSLGKRFNCSSLFRRCGCAFNQRRTDSKTTANSSLSGSTHGPNGSLALNVRENTNASPTSHNSPTEPS